MTEHRQVRHKPPAELAHPRALVVACPEMHSNVNLSRIVRAAGCFGVQQIVACGRPRVDPKIARDAVDRVELLTRRSLPAPLRQFRDQGYRLVGLEQTNDSVSLFDYAFVRETVLVVGNERQGLAEEVLAMLDDVVEIPVYGLPYSFNAATAAIMAMYEYCRQHR